MFQEDNSNGNLNRVKRNTGKSLLRSDHRHQARGEKVGKKQETPNSRAAAGTVEGMEKGETRGPPVDNKEGGGTAG